MAFPLFKAVRLTNLCLEILLNNSIALVSPYFPNGVGIVCEGGFCPFKVRCCLYYSDFKTIVLFGLVLLFLWSVNFIGNSYCSFLQTIQCVFFFLHTVQYWCQREPEYHVCHLYQIEKVFILPKASKTICPLSKPAAVEMAKNVFNLMHFNNI